MVDPEIPVLTIADLGVLRDVQIVDGAVEVDHHADLFRLPGDEHDRARRRSWRWSDAGFAHAADHDRAVAGLDHRLDERGGQGQARGLWHRAAGGQGVAPRAVRRGRRSPVRVAVRRNTERISEFGSTACKALWRCQRLRRAVRLFQVHLRRAMARRIPSAESRRRAPRDAGRGVDRIRRAAGACGRISLSARPAPDACAAICDGEDMPPLLFDLHRARRRRIARRGEEGRGGAVLDALQRAIKPGDAIDVMTPQGRFGVVPDPATRAIISRSPPAPASRRFCRSCAAMLDARAEKPLRADLRQPHDSRSIIFKEALEDLKDRFLDRLVGASRAVARAAGDRAAQRPHRRGEDRDAAQVACAAPREIDHAFLCGPGGLIEEGKARAGAARRSGRAHPHRVFLDRWRAGDAAPRRLAQAATRGSRSRSAQSRFTARLMTCRCCDGETIIDAGLRAGLEMPYSCRGGMCCTCRGEAGVRRGADGPRIIRSSLGDGGGLSCSPASRIR